GLQIIADRLSKFDRSARVGISKMARIQRTKTTCAELAPQFQRSVVDQRASEVERPLIALHRDIDEIAERLHLHGFERDRRRRLLASRWISLDRLGEIRRYVGAGAVPAGGISFGEKLLEGGHRGRARH